MATNKKRYKKVMDLSFVYISLCRTVIGHKSMEHKSIDH